MASPSIEPAAGLGALVAEERTLLALHGRLLTLTDQTRWDGQHVPIAPRAFADGALIHTNDLRIHLGDGYWADMTAKQAAAFVNRKITDLQARIRLLQAQMVEAVLPSNTITPRKPPGLAMPSMPSSPLASTTTELPAPSRTVSSPALASASASASSPSPTPAASSARKSTPADIKSKPVPAANGSAVKPAPVGQTRTLKDEKGKLMTDDLGFPIVEIIEPPSSPTSSKRKAPPPISPVSRRTEKQRAEARKRAFDEAERDEKREAEKQAKAKPSSRLPDPDALGEMKRLKGQDGKDLLDDDGLPMIEIVEPVSSASTSTATPSSSLATLPPARSKAERTISLRRVLDEAEAEEAASDSASKASQTVDPPGSAPMSLAGLDDPLKLVEELLSPAETEVCATGTTDPVVPVNVLHEILSEDGLPISRIQEPLPSTPTSGARSSDSTTFDPTAPLPPATPLPLAPSAQTPVNVKQSIFDKLEAEEKEMERRERLGLPPLEPEVVAAPEEDDEGEDTGWGQDEDEVLESLTTPDNGKGKGKAKDTSAGPDKRKSVSWSETDDVKEFKSTESPSAPSPPSVKSDAQPPAEEGGPSSSPVVPAGETMKFKVVERAPVPIKAGKVKMGGAKEGGKTGWVKPVVTDEAMAYLANLEAKKAAAAATPAPSTKVDDHAPIPIKRPTAASHASAPPPPSFQPAPSSSEPIPSATVEEIESDHDVADDDSGSNDSFQFSDDDDEDDGNGGGMSMDMDNNMQLREAAVEYYRLRGVLQGKGGLSGAGGGTGDLEDRSEFVPLNATVSQSLDSTTLSLPTGPLNSSAAASRFKSSILTPAESASVDLPTLIPGGGATGALAGAIRVGKLENGKLVVGRGDGLDEDEDSSDEEGEGEEGEMTEAGKEALMWGMVGGVVVQPEDLEKGGEELLARLKGETPAVETPVAETAARVDFYQADKTVTVSVYEKGLIPADVRVEFEARQVLIHLPTRSITLSPLSAPINATLSSFRVSPVKIELTLMKSQVGLRWDRVTTPSTTVAAAPHPPSTAVIANGTVSTSTLKPVAAASTPVASPPAPSAPAKVSRFKAARQAGVSILPSTPAPAAEPASTPAPATEEQQPAPVQASPPPLVSDPKERTSAVPVPVSAPTPMRQEQAPQVASEQGGGGEPTVVEEEEKPKKRVSRFKKERRGA